MRKTFTIATAVTALALGSTAGALATGHVAIVSPSAGAAVFGDTLVLEATATADTPVNVAVRETTDADSSCSLGTTNVLYRDVSGTLSTDDAGVYSDTIDISGASTGLYCFAFDPADGPRISQKFYVADGRVSGGGQILDGSFKVSFGGEAYAIADTSGANVAGVGSWTVQFHDVGEVGVSGTTFSGDEISDMNFFADGSVANFVVTGTWDGVAGHSVIVRAEDRGEPGSNDNVRFTLRNPGGGVVYDTFPADFPGESDNVGTARTSVDRGNLQVETR